MARQLPLGIALNATCRFDNFVAGGNAAVLQAVHACARGSEPRFVYVWGPPGSGRSHLLQAACHEAGGQGRTPLYLPLERQSELSAQALDGAGALPLVCLDDLHAVAGRPEWEGALFRTLNELRDQGGSLIVAASGAPAGIGIALPDVVSRLSAAAVFRMRALSDADKSAVLRERARERGIDLGVDVRDYLLRHCHRDVGALLGLLDTLDRAALAAQRRITVPFVKEVLERGGGGGE